MHRVLTALLILLPLAWPVWSEPGSKRIVGGEDTSIEAYPHQVSFPLDFRRRCGGSIISKTFIVTAAHCTYKMKAERINVRVNSSFVYTEGVVHKVKRIYIHPKYVQEASTYDISVLELEEPIEFTAGAQPIALPDKSDCLAAGKVVAVTGWGLRKSGAKYPDMLQVVEVPIVAHDVCVEAYKNYRLAVTEDMLCAGYLEEGGKDSCGNDSGGPLIADGKLYGVVSWGYKCALPHYPGVYADVSYLRDFIKEKSGV